MLNFEIASFISFRDIKKNHFRTAEAEAKADVDESIKRKRIRVSLKKGQKGRIRHLRCCISREPFEFTSMPICPTFAQDMTSRTTSVRKLQRQKVENAASYGFRWNFSGKVYVRITKFHAVVGDNWPNKSVGHDVAGCFRSAENAIKYRTIVMLKTGPAGQRVK